MVIIQLTGGLGNQLFQYAFAKKIALSNQSEVFLDLEFFKTYEWHDYSLNPFKFKKNSPKGIISFFIKPILGIFLLLIYPVQMLRLIIKSNQSFYTACVQAFFLTIGKFAEMAGKFKFLWHRFSNKPSQIIEYK